MDRWADILGRLLRDGEVYELHRLPANAGAIGIVKNAVGAVVQIASGADDESVCQALTERIAAGKAVLSIAEVCKILSVSRAMYYHYQRQGFLFTVEINGRPHVTPAEVFEVVQAYRLPQAAAV